MNRFFFALGLSWLGCLFATDAHAVRIDWVTVGDAGNVADTVEQLPVTLFHGKTFGAVDYDYRIGKFEVTVSQYAEFLNAVAVEDPNGLYTFWMDANIDEPYSEGDGPRGGIRRDFEPGSYHYTVQPGYENQPVIFTSFLDAARFANWLHNGQPTGPQESATTEDGAYTLTPSAISNNTVSRNAGARFFVPSGDEWYKAAYYKGGGSDAGYWTYPTQSDSPPSATSPPGGPNAANYAPDGPSTPHPAILTEVGSYTDSPGPYGTFDQAGNVWEWTEWAGSRYDGRRVFGGDVHNRAIWMTPGEPLFASLDDDLGAGSNCCNVGGFRLASVALPTGTISTSADTSYTVTSEVANAATRASASADAITASTAGFVGELDGEGVNALSRLISRFSLVTVPDDEALDGLVSAKLRFHLETTHGLPAGPVSVFHSTTDNDLEQSPSDYDDPSYADTGLDLVQPSDVAPAYYEVDVTDWVLADYRNDPGVARSAFRLEVDGALFLEDDVSHGYQFADGLTVVHRPVLVLHFVPEPSTQILIVVSLVSFFLITSRGTSAMNTSRRGPLCSLAAALTVGLISTNDALAAKGGNGKPSVLPGIRYVVTPVTLPAGAAGNFFRTSDHNEAAAVVGWASDAANVRRAIAYLPSISLSQAFDLDDPALGIVGIPPGWHVRSAVGINNHGDIVGNLESNDPANLTRKAFLLVSSGGAPQLTVLGPFDPAAQIEYAHRINDSGDIVAVSQKNTAADPSVRYSLYVGNPGLYGNPPVAFQRVDFLAAGAPYEGASELPPELSNRLGASPAVLAGRLDDESDTFFRMRIDGSQFELAPNYTAADGSSFEWISTADIDINDYAHVLGRATVLPRKKGQFNRYAAIWPLGAAQYEPVAATEAVGSPWDYAAMNNDGDFVLQSFLKGAPHLWHGDWSPSHGAISIAEMLHPDDPNRSLFEFAWELTDRRGNGWPIIFGRGTTTVDGLEHPVLLILSPVAFP
jgi:hypothetical protein